MDNKNNVEEISSLVEDLLKDIKKLTNSTISIKGSFGTRVYILTDKYNSNLNELSSYMENSFVPAYHCMKKYKENKEEIDKYNKSKDSLVKEFEQKTYNDFISEGKSESEGRYLAYEASRKYRTKIENKIEMLKSENNSLRNKIDLLSDERLQTTQFNESGIYSERTSESQRLYEMPSNYSNYSNNFDSRMRKTKKLYKTEYGDYEVINYNVQNDYGKYKIRRYYETIPYKLRIKTKPYKVQNDYGTMPNNFQSDYGTITYKASGNYFKNN